MNKKDYHLFQAAREAARNADYSGANAVQIGCVAAYKGTILAKGCNSDKTHPVQKQYNVLRYKDIGNNYLPEKIHAETDVIRRIKDLDIDKSKVHLYIYREFKNGNLAPSRCCPSCIAMLRASGIKHIHYTTQDGFAHEILK